MNNYKYNPINMTPFKWFCLENFPFIEEDFDSLTSYSLYCKLKEYFDKVAHNVNEMGTQVESLTNAFIVLKDYVDNYFKNLDVQDEINNKLDEMVTDGTLETIISNYLNINNINYITNIGALAYRKTGETKGLQGGCYCGDGNVACYFTSTNTIQIISLATMQVLREYSNSIFGHGNGLTKKGNYLYLCGTGVSNNNVYKIPYDTLNSYEVVNVFGENKIPANTNISCIAYDNIEDKFYITSAPVFPTLTTYVFNGDFSELLDTFNFYNEDFYGGFITNICIFKNYLIVNYNYGKLQIFNKIDMSLNKNCNLNLSAGNRYYSEIEWLDNYGNDLIIGAVGFIGEGYGNGNIFFGKTNLYSSSREYPVLTTKKATKYKFPKNNRVHVNIDADFVPNRDGSYEKPFLSIYEALNSCLIDDFETINIYIDSIDYVDEGIYLENLNKNIRIYGSSNENSILQVRELKVESVTDVYLRNIFPINNIYLKDCKTIFYFNDSSVKELNIEGYNTSQLFINASQNTIKLRGHSDGEVTFNQFNRQEGITTKLESENSYTPLFNCRNVKNCIERARLDGSAYTPSTTFIFFTPVTKTVIDVQVGNYYIQLPVTNHNKNYDVTLPDNSKLNVKIEYDNTTFGFNCFKFTLTHETLIIYDVFVSM